ncbi:hypothetical protein LL912_08125 [Niabella sp. CC-SYL272]|uniref:hypothetical protein n=1 Tax=Niabella agricola TaxID=2891571 RepID=UPI001F2CCE07|nr:hypothetical protein [Niabella agricola]MCF3108742.1 hypothetical protein [Niabella agricola]
MQRIHIVRFCFLYCSLLCFATVLFSQPLQWKQSGDGWILKKNAGSEKYERFFAIGTWHVPGYSFTDSAETHTVATKNANLFKTRTAPFNMVFVTPGQQKEYMSEKIQILNPFSPMLHHYLDRIPDLPKGKDKDYYRSQVLKKEVNKPEFDHYLDSAIGVLMKQLPNGKYIYSHIDEIALGGVSKWMVPPAVGAKIYERVRNADKKALVFVDLLGHGRGSTYFFEQNYLAKNSALPQAPPYELLDTQALANKNIPLLGFFQASDGTPVYQFDDDGKYAYRNYDLEALKQLWFENVSLVAEAYKSSGDVFGMNAFMDFNANPIMSAVTTDALKAGLGKDVPVWLYFDGNGYAKPAQVSPEAYINMVKCQIYTSIIHGATGILFWNDWSKKPDVFSALLPMLAELNANMEIIRLPTVAMEARGHRHVLIKQGGGKKYIIASNTSKTDAVVINLSATNKKILQPLAVHIFVL